MRQKPQEEEPEGPELPRKKIYSVCKLNNLKIKEATEGSSFKNPLKVHKTLGGLNKFILPVSNPVDFVQAYTQINKLLALSFGVVVNNEGYSRIRRGKVESGNNGLLVKQTVKKRLWWNIVTEEYCPGEGDTINLLWTQHTLSSKQSVKFM